MERKKRIHRPWDHGIDRELDSPTKSNRKNRNDHPPPETISSPVSPPSPYETNVASPQSNSSVPSVEINGIKFYSDRFYLNAPTGVFVPSTSSSGDCLLCSRCGSMTSKPPPMFDRSALIRQLSPNLKAVIASTFTLDVPWLMHEMPTLFPPSSMKCQEKDKIPVLVLHGHRGSIPNLGSHFPNKSPTKNTTNNNNSKSFQKSVKREDLEQGDLPPEEGWIHVSNFPKQDSSMPQKNALADSVIFTQVLSAWIPSAPHAYESWMEAQLKTKNNPSKRRSRSVDSSPHDSVCHELTSPSTHNDKQRRNSDMIIDYEDFERWKREDLGVPSPTSSPNLLTPNHEVIVIDNDDDHSIDHKIHKTNNNHDNFNDTTTTTSTTTTPIPQYTTSSDHEGRTNKAHPTTQDHERKHCRGVHHPKYLLLFEKTGSLVVVVSTSNLTRESSVDGSWIQRFPPRKTQRHTNNNDDDEGKKETMRRNGSDFGHVLVDFLHHQSLACTPSSSSTPTTTPSDFLCRHLNLNNMQDLLWKYEFGHSQVHLIATIPGHHRGRHSSVHLGAKRKRGNGMQDQTRTMLYGPQRVADIVSRLSRNMIQGKSTSHQRGEINIDNSVVVDKAWLPPNTLSAKDRLVVQTTSFGGNWKRHDMEIIFRSYMGMDSNGVMGCQKEKVICVLDDDDEGDDDNDLLDKMDIVWPTQNYMDGLQRQMKKNAKALSLVEHSDDETKPLCQTAEEISSPFAIIQNNKTKTDNSSSIPEESPLSSSIGHFAFLSTRSFNQMDLSCISRMVLYEPCLVPQQHHVPWNLSPHLKTYCRLLSQSNAKAAAGEDCPLAWCMLTSACLSRGAQGQPVPWMKCLESDGPDNNDFMAYANFELGILFCSRLSHIDVRSSESSPNRLYGWFPRHCPQCRHDPNNDSKTKYIHLPIPHRLFHLTSYQLDDDDADMFVSPYFHELSPNTCDVGKMKLTPLGKKMAHKRQENKEE